MLKHVPAESFDLLITQAHCAKCSSSPDWLDDLLTSGAEMELAPLLTQAGRHFADAINPDVMPGSGTARKLATELAWYLVAMLRPTVRNRKLYVVKPRDKDIQRIASEILGVGAGLELLRRYSSVDRRTFKKLGERFDFQVRGRGGKGLLKIELKGTVNATSVKDHRKSIRKKLSGRKLRDYDRAIGLIFSSWTPDKTRSFDIEVVDPAGAPHANRDAAIRDALQHYARRFDEDIQLYPSAQHLWNLAKEKTPIEEIENLRPWLSYIPASSRVERRFNRCSLRLRMRSRILEFWGGYWEGTAVAPPIVSAKFGSHPFGYIGIDPTIIQTLREHRFDDFLSYRFDDSFSPEEVRSGFTSFRGTDEPNPGTVGQEISGILFAEDDGTIRAWLSALPRGVIDVR